AFPCAGANRGRPPRVAPGRGRRAGRRAGAGPLRPPRGGGGRERRRALRCPRAGEFIAPGAGAAPPPGRRGSGSMTVGPLFSCLPEGEHVRVRGPKESPMKYVLVVAAAPLFATTALAERVSGLNTCKPVRVHTYRLR